MPFWIYILHNPVIRKFYIGQTSNPEARIKSQMNKLRPE